MVFGVLMPMPKKWNIGDIFPAMELETVRGDRIHVPDPRELVHFQFRRFAGCPICNLHLRSIAGRIGQIRAAGVKEVAVFHSSRETMLPYQGDLPFAAIADPARRLYVQFGVASSPRAVLDPRAWIAGLRGRFAKHPSNRNVGEGGHLGLPAEFLVAPDGRILARKYGSHANDQWTVDELLSLARRAKS